MGLQVFPNIRAMSVYGPTEVTAVTVHHPYGKDPDHIVIGRPDANTHVYIVDARMRPVPVGVPGELLLSGPRLAIGEWLGDSRIPARVAIYTVFCFCCRLFRAPRPD